MANGPGPNNDLTDIAGVSIGNAIDENAKTGVTVIIPDTPAVVAGDVRGGGPGARETDLLNPSTLVERADAIVLSGGSSYGLGAADGVTAWLGARERGFQLIAKEGVPPSPIVPGAILYDLANGGDKKWGDTPPYFQLGQQACNSIGSELNLGVSGAGFGASAGAERGGLGSASYFTEDGLKVGALVAVNSFGSVRMPGSECFWAWPFELNAEFGGITPSGNHSPAVDLPSDTKLAATARSNTTIGVVAVEGAINQADVQRIAIMAQDGIARAIRPVHGPTDGDILFVMAIENSATSLISEPDPLTITRLGNIAADCVARAIARAVFEANS